MTVAFIPDANMPLDLQAAISRFGKAATAKLSHPSTTGEPEYQLRAPLETLFQDLAELCHFKRDDLDAIGETSLADLKTRPDYAITLRKLLVGHVELKAPRQGREPEEVQGQTRQGTVG